jgi:hypothetical protein
VRSTARKKLSARNNKVSYTVVVIEPFCLSSLPSTLWEVHPGIDRESRSKAFILVDLESLFMYIFIDAHWVCYNFGLDY